MGCEVQQAALRLGEPVYLSEGEARSCDRTIDEHPERAWDLWRRTHVPRDLASESNS